MKRKGALTIPVAGEKDKSISLAMIVDCKARYRDLKSKSGSMKFGRTSLGLPCRHPCVILTDVLKTEEGKAFLDRKRQSLANGERVTRTQRESGRWREDSTTCRDRVSGLRQARKVTPERNQRTTCLSSERLRRRSQNAEEAEDKEENKEIKEVTTGKDSREEVVACGLTVSWKHARDAGGNECSPGSRKADPRQQSSKRKVADNGTDAPKRPRRSVLHLFPDRDTPRRQTPKRQTPVCLYLDKSEEDVKVAVREDERTETLIPVISHDLEDRLCSSQENITKSSPSTTNCELSVDQKHVGDAGNDESSPARRKDKWTDPNLNRKRNDPGSPAIRTDAPKGHRGSVLHRSPETTSYKRQVSVDPHLDKSKEDGESENMGHEIVQITVGEDERTKALSPAISQNLDTRGNHRRYLSSRLDNITKTSSSGTIVVSSDEEYSYRQRHSPVFHPLVNQEEPHTHKKPTQEAVAKQQYISDKQKMDVGRHNVPLSLPNTDMVVAFCELFSGCYNGKANGDITVTNQKIIIPLKDPNEQVKVTLTVERKELRSYSVWEDQQVQAWWSRIGNEGSPPAAVLQFHLSKPQVAAVECKLRKLAGKQDGTTTTGQASNSLVLTLREPLVGLEGALLRSLLDIVCLNNLTDQNDTVAPGLGLGLGSINGVDDIQTHASSQEGSPELIERTQLDPQLLSLPGEESAAPEPNTDQDCTLPEGNTTLQTEDEPQEESPVAPSPETQLKSEDEQKEQEEKLPAETSREKPTPIYILRHVRTNGSYCVSFVKPDSSWTKYTHQAQPHRLIQFPPPPLKGGIPVTMDDLQCLDNGKYLNDVIIDFYLKYLLHNASAAVAERCYIFSSFFFNQLTRGNSMSKGGPSDICQRQWRHQRVKNWTRHVDIFKKDFLFVPVNQEAHWFLVVICFPGMDETKLESWAGPVSPVGKRHGRLSKVQGPEDTQSSNGNTKTSPASNLGDSVDTLTENEKEDVAKETSCGPPNCTEHTCQSKIVCKRPCILIMDSLKRCLHQRVIKILQEYLQSEWEVRCGSSRIFSPENMKSSCCQVPLQDNSTDCGLYLLQYVESFLKDPVVNFELPLHLEHWFSRQQMWTKRDEIRNVVLKLHRHQNL